MPEPYDILIAGGGINGCGIACDAASRGLHVCLAEGGDLAQGTSSASSKLIHGGLRYLEQYEFRLVREALTEREILMRMAPHIVRPMRFVLPHAPGMRPKWMLRLGLFLYDWLGKRVTLPASHGLDLAQDEAGAPLQPQYRSGFEYSDCYADDARLTILNARAAANRGATILTRTNVAAARREDGLWFVRHAPRAADPLEVRTRILVKAAGPGAGRRAGDLPHGEASPRLRLVQGAHIVIPALYGHGKAYIFQNHDRRIVFAIPFEEEFTLIGTTDTEFSGDPAKSKPLASEIDYLLAAVNAYFRRQLQTSDVVWTFAGVRALADDVGGTAQTASRDYRLEVDAPEGEAPLLTVLGGKITSYRT
ncbi:MAG: glycerol-3-phosphate dehydrogenase, partial [Beijerinckiaceae bacterium]